MKVFYIIFLAIVGLYLLLLLVVASNNTKEFIKKLFKSILWVIIMIIGCVIFIALLIICRKLVGNWFVASALTIAISLLIVKLIDK